MPAFREFPVVETYEGRSGGRVVAVVSLTQDQQTWIAGITEGDSVQHIGSIASIEEARQAATAHLKDAAIVWAPVAVAVK